MKKRCDVLGNDELSRYLDRELASEAIQHRIEGHLKSCPLCQEQLRELQETRSILLKISDVPEAPDQWSLIRGRLQSRPASQKKNLLQLSAWRRWAPMAASIFLLILAVGLFWPFGSERATDVEPYLGLYLLAANASDVISSEIPPERLDTLKLNFVDHVPSSIGSWKRGKIYYHKLHGQPVVQVFYSEREGKQYCVFQQSGEHRLDFGSRQTQQELVENQICTKFVDHHFNLISWQREGTRFTLVSTSSGLDLQEIAAQWITRLEQGGSD